MLRLTRLSHFRRLRRARRLPALLLLTCILIFVSDPQRVLRMIDAVEKHVTLRDRLFRRLVFRISVHNVYDVGADQLLHMHLSIRLISHHRRLSRLLFGLLLVLLFAFLDLCELLLRLCHSWLLGFRIA